MSTCIVSENIGTFVGCDPTIRLDCNLVAWVQLTVEPLVSVTEIFISSLMLEPVIQGFFLMRIYHVSNCSNSFNLGYFGTLRILALGLLDFGYFGFRYFGLGHFGLGYFGVEPYSAYRILVTGHNSYLTTTDIKH